MQYAIHTLLSRTAHAQENFLRPHLKKLGLSPGQPKVLRSLAFLGACTQKSSPSTATWIPLLSAGCSIAWRETDFSSAVPLRPIAAPGKLP